MPRRCAAFSLVELSIVLVILGLLVGGILAGQSLIRASELRAVTTEADRYTTAIHAFRDKYMGLPGDILNATSFWGDQATGTGACASASTPDGTPGTCNGNGDGRFNEPYRFWQQLALAGLIEGTYSGWATGATAVPGTNVPTSKLANGAWGTWGITMSGWLGWQGTKEGNWMFLGSYYSGNQAIAGAIRPEEAWNVDTKTDDGMPATGKTYGGTGYLVTPACTSGTGAATLYALGTSSAVCGVSFLQN